MANAINRFLELIDTESFHIPFSAQWAVFIQLPDGLRGEITNILSFEDNRWYQANDIFSDLTKQPIFTDEGIGCIFADSVTQVGDGFGVVDADIGDSGTTGGIIPGVYSKNRAGFAQKQLKMKFRETSLSFTDFVIRPWIILASHYGRIADKNNVTKSPEITVINFRKGASPVQIRKSFKYFQCTPYMVDDMEMSYEKDNVMSYNVTWVFERYAIDAPDRAAAGREAQERMLRIADETRKSQPRPQGIIKQDAKNQRQQRQDDPAGLGFDPLNPLAPPSNSRPSTNNTTRDELNNFINGR